MIQFTDKGLYCPPGNFYIDPWKPVDRAVITHAHSDHARAGNGYYLCHHQSVPVLKQRLGDIHVESVEWNQPILHNGVKISLHPAGHIIGSSQVRLELNGDVWVFSGDYKTENDGISGQFEPVICNTFITESTFGLPIYHWKKQETIYSEIQQWVAESHVNGKTPVIIAYSLGKAQRVLKCVAEICNKIYAHGAVWNTHQALTAAGYQLPALERVNPDTPKDNFKNAVIIAPPSAESSSWMKRFAPYSIGICSGWMQVRGNVRRKNADAGFALSDHADWPGLLSAVEATGAQKVFVTHGFQAAFSRYLTEKGIAAAEVKTEYGSEDDEQIPASEEQPTKTTE
jgi:putative mRNA 3-end processing factor